MCAWMRQSLLFFLVEDLIDAYQAMRSSLDVHESDEVITAFFASVKVLVTAGKISHPSNSKIDILIANFRVELSLSIKVRPGAQPFT